jgi:hypothetical protein
MVFLSVTRMGISDGVVRSAGERLDAVTLVAVPSSGLPLGPKLTGNGAVWVAAKVLGVALGQ